VAVQADGKLIVGVQTIETVVGVTEWRNFIVRYNSDGTPDDSFGQGGAVKGWGVVGVLPNQQFLAAIGTGTARYNPDGTLDQSFGVEGISPATGNTWRLGPDGSAQFASFTSHGLRVDLMGSDGQFFGRELLDIPLAPLEGVDYQQWMFLNSLADGDVVVAGRGAPYAQNSGEWNWLTDLIVARLELPAVPVPEPTGFVLFALGVGGLMCRVPRTKVRGR
jgi:hypothetical protein